MKCAIMQPTFLPWAGYFNLISKVETFVFLDDAQFVKSSWHSRNRILVNQKPHWISTPVRRERLNQTIRETPLDDRQLWRSKHVKLLQQVYAKHPFSSSVMELCEFLDKDDSIFLADFNVRLIRWFLEKMEVTTSIIFSSELIVDGTRTERLINILKAVKAESYLSPQGAREYLEEDHFVERTSVLLGFQNYECLPYSQFKNPEFEGFLSIVDVVANLGWSKTQEYIDNTG